MRPDLDHYMMELAKVAATRTTCIRRGVGCVLADAKGHVLSIAYNGVASGMSHCNEAQGGQWMVGPTGEDFVEHFPNACLGHTLPPGQDSCEAVHAEQNALLQCRDPQTIKTAYVTFSPCKPCLKLLLNTSCRRIVFLEELEDTFSRGLWLSTGRDWVQLV